MVRKPLGVTLKTSSCGFGHVCKNEDDHLFRPELSAFNDIHV